MTAPCPCDSAEEAAVLLCTGHPAAAVIDQLPSAIEVAMRHSALRGSGRR